MNAIDELGYTTRAMRLMTDKLNVRGQVPEDRKGSSDGAELLRVFRKWKAEVFDVKFAIMSQRYLKAKRDAPLLGIQCDKSDYDGEKVTMREDIKTSNRRTQHLYLLKLYELNKADMSEKQLENLATDIGLAYNDNENITDFDTEIRDSDVYKTL